MSDFEQGISIEGLDSMVANFEGPIPLKDEAGEVIGTIYAIEREGGSLVMHGSYDGGSDEPWQAPQADWSPEAQRPFSAVATFGSEAARAEANEFLRRHF